MYVKPCHPFMPPHVPGPPGVNPALAQDRMPVVRVVNGDSWRVSLSLVDPVSGGPATPENTRVEFVVAENRFTEQLWTGMWGHGVEPSAIVPGLVHVVVPQEMCSSLRRGVYAFSAKVMDNMGTFRETQAKGHFQVEYEPTSDIHDIPYRPGSGSGSGSAPEWGPAGMNYVLRGSVERFADLPDHPVVGDAWNVVESVDEIPAGTNWVWNGSSWDPLGGAITTEMVQQAIESGGYGVISFDEEGNPYVSVPEGGHNG